MKESSMPVPANIRRLFLAPHPTYSPPDAAALLGMSSRELDGWMAAGELEGEQAADGLVLPWHEVVSFAMSFWDQEEVEAALGDDLAAAIPELLRLAELHVRIPRMEVVALERVAARDGKTVSAVLGRELLDFVSTHAEWLGRDVPGLGDALAWPA
jgi:DNA-binding ferritin-like protein (Dps family)